MKTKAIVIRTAEQDEELQKLLGPSYDVIRGLSSDFKMIRCDRDIEVLLTLMDITVVTVSVDTELFLVSTQNPIE